METATKARMHSSACGPCRTTQTELDRLDCQRMPGCALRGREIDGRLLVLGPHLGAHFEIGVVVERLAEPSTVSQVEVVTGLRPG